MTDEEDGTTNFDKRVKTSLARLKQSAVEALHRLENIGHHLRQKRLRRTRRVAKLDQTYVFSFDRDGTVDVSLGPVPLEWVKYLAQETHHEVWAHGNQRLKAEAGIPGIAELQEILVSRRGGDKKVRHVGYVRRRQRLRMVMQACPGADRYICVDDINLSDLRKEGWEYYTPRGFVRAFEWMLR